VSRRDLARTAQVRDDLKTGRAPQVREAAGIKVRELAVEVGASRQAVSQWELGRCVPGAAHALAYGRLLEAVAQVAAPHPSRNAT
jgi:DNA-binding XRE family transcriptional regulator